MKSQGYSHKCIWYTVQNTKYICTHTSKCYFMHNSIVESKNSSKKYWVLFTTVRLSFSWSLTIWLWLISYPSDNDSCNLLICCTPLWPCLGYSRYNKQWMDTYKWRNYSAIGYVDLWIQISDLRSFHVWLSIWWVLNVDFAILPNINVKLSCH